MKLKAEVWSTFSFKDGTSVSLREMVGTKHISITLIKSDYEKYTRSIFAKEKTSYVIAIRYARDKSIGFQFKWK